ncbi:MAG TPA: DUF177 domain-containing protein [Capsulimonadaceae bacterium]|nr:DUF177 domain-containing protein [Capsulimonadaceae bacterium]
MFRIDLAEIIRTVGKQQAYEIDEPPFTDEDVEYVAPIRGRVTVTNSGRVLLVRGSVDTVVSLECARCLIDVRQPVHAILDEQFSLSEVENAVYHDVAPTIVQDEENEVPPGLFDGNVMNLNVLIRQAVILNSPLRPLCREDCAGLCLTCGKNLNEAACSCPPANSGRPLAALGDLLKGDQASRN